MPIFKSLSLIGNCGLTLLDWEFKTSKNEIFDHKNGIKLILGRYLTFLTQEFFSNITKSVKSAKIHGFSGFLKKILGPFFDQKGAR